MCPLPFAICYLLSAFRYGLFAIGYLLSAGVGSYRRLTIGYRLFLHLAAIPAR